MGLTNSSTGMKVAETELTIKKRSESDTVIALAGNPNVGKSTLFNSLTGLNQHTGNWPGKTVSNAQGYCKYKNSSFVFVDIPGTYSLFSHSPEEEIARDFICFGKADTVVVVCDATCLERSINLVLQILEITKNVVVCINLLDEAKRKGIKIDLQLLSKKLGVKVVGMVAKNKKQRIHLLETLTAQESHSAKSTFTPHYSPAIEMAIASLESAVADLSLEGINPRWLCLKLLENDLNFLNKIEAHSGYSISKKPQIQSALADAHMILEQASVNQDTLRDETAASLIKEAEKICKQAVSYTNTSYSLFDRKIDKVLTSRFFAFPVMLILLAFIFWLTVSGANYFSEGLSNLLFGFEKHLETLFSYLQFPVWLKSLLIEGAYRVPAWVVSVMLPPMAIFFPLFTLLEDVGYLPRIAYNLDRPFYRCNSCGKQALTMCMGFGCNAAGVVGCRIIDSPRERLVATVTNSMVPCNGRFPAIISIISIFFVTGFSYGKSLVCALVLTLFILLAVFVTFAATKLLSATVLKGTPSSYTLEMPPYRKPKILQLLVRSVFDRTLFVLGRSVLVAVPAGIIIWLMANIIVEDRSLLSLCADFLNPFALLLGLDGAILMGFILGFPANEIVIPITMMIYLSSGSLAEISELSEMSRIFALNGWTPVTALCTVVFSLFHWPCSTTLLTIKKETGSLKWTFLSAIFPTAIGIVICFIIKLISQFFI